MSKVFIALVSLAILGASGCAMPAPRSADTTGVDAVVLTSTEGDRVMVFPAAGIMLREGSHDSVDVQVHWVAAADAGRGRLQVLSADGTRVYADVSLRDVAIQHRVSGHAFTPVDPTVALGELTVGERPSE